MIKAIAIDDEPKALDVIKSHVSRIPIVCLQEVFSNPFEAVEYLSSNAIELVFVDINMPDLSGLELVRSFALRDMKVIFTTAHAEFALESYNVHAVDYLLKPFEFARFLKAVLKAHDAIQKDNKVDDEFFFVNTGYQLKKIFVDEILFIEGDGNYVTYHCNDEKIIVRGTIKECLQQFTSRYFIQLHKSFVVSLNKVDKVQDNHVFIGSNRIAIGPNYRADFFNLVKRKR